MDVTLHIPDDLAARLTPPGADIARFALEGFALEQYRTGRISKAELRRLLGFETRYELDGFLKAHDVPSDYTIDDFRRELSDLREFGCK